MTARKSSTPATTATPDLQAILAALPPEIAAAIAAANANAAATAAPAPRQAQPRAVANDPSPSDVAAAMSNAMGALRSRGARGHGGDTFSTGSRGYRGVFKITVNGVDMSCTVQAVINKSKPA